MLQFTIDAIKISPVLARALLVLVDVKVTPSKVFVLSLEFNLMSTDLSENKLYILYQII